MFFKNLEKGPEFKVHEKDRYLAEKHNFGEFLESTDESISSNKKKTFIKLITLFILFLILFILCFIEYYHYANDFIGLFKTETLDSTLHDLSLKDYDLLRILIFVRFILIALAAGFLAYLVLGFILLSFTDYLPKSLTKGLEKLRIDENYIISLIKHHQSSNKKKNNELIIYNNQEHKYKLIGTYSSADPKKLFDSFLDLPLSSYGYLLILGLLIASTGLITSFTNQIIIEEEGVILNRNVIELLITSINSIAFLFGGGFIAIRNGLIYFRNHSRFMEFIYELIERQQNYLTELLVKYENELSDKTHSEKEKADKTHSEKEKAVKELQILEELYTVPQKNRIKTLISLIPLLITVLIAL